MVKYRRNKEYDTWHWCTNCSNWPTENFVETELPKGQRPSTGELDNECRAKEKVGTCFTT